MITTPAYDERQRRERRRIERRKVLARAAELLFLLLIIGAFTVWAIALVEKWRR